jgi:NAD(P)-dependent dehydrogenase (short-subunit alcohol dehydrogenase family)
MTQRQPTALITGNSSGLGLGFTRVLNAEGWAVHGLSRRGCPEPVAGDVQVDLADLDAIGPAVTSLLAPVDKVDLVILNAGVLGRIQNLSEADLDELRHTMDINLFANKPVLDHLLARGLPVSQIIAISSGASVSGSAGWSGYALSKAALNMMMSLYAHEFTDTSVHALAPGLIDTAMQEYLCENSDGDRFDSIQNLRQARGTPVMPEADEAARQVLASLPRLRGLPSGRFVDIRQL